MGPFQVPDLKYICAPDTQSCATTPSPSLNFQRLARFGTRMVQPRFPLQLTEMEKGSSFWFQIRSSSIWPMNPSVRDNVSPPGGGIQ